MIMVYIVIGIVLFLGVIALQAGIAQIVCKRMCQKVFQDIRSQRDNLNERIQWIEQRLTHLARREKYNTERVQIVLQWIQEQTTQHRTDKQLLERLERLEKRVHSGESPIIDKIPPYMPPEATRWVNDTSRQSLTASRSSVDLEEIAFSLLDLIKPKGRSSPLARMAGLNDWLRANHPSLEAEPIGALNQDLWRLVVLTADRKTGIVAPALDSIVGPSESLKWFEGGRYDGTQTLVRANVSALARAVRDEETQTWRPRLKGKIDLT